MKKLFTFFSAIILSNIVIAQIPNAGFETWTNTSGYNMPTGWDNLNSMTAPMTTYTCEKGTPGYVGSGYLQITSKAVSGMGVVPGIAVSGVLDTATLEPKSGFACSARPANLTGEWTYMASGSDQAHIIVLLSKWNTAMGMRDTVSYTYYSLSGMAMSWASFTIPLTYLTGEVPDSAIIVLSASRATPVAGSYLYVDTLAFTGSVPTGVANIVNTSVSSLYPNPATGTTTISYHCASGSEIKILVNDMRGKSLRTFPLKATAGDNKFPINVSDLSKGLYIVEIVDGQNIQSQKLVIE